MIMRIEAGIGDIGEKLEAYFSRVNLTIFGSLFKNSRFGLTNSKVDLVVTKSQGFV